MRVATVEMLHARRVRSFQCHRSCWRRSHRRRNTGHGRSRCAAFKSSRWHCVVVREREQERSNILETRPCSTSPPSGRTRLDANVTDQERPRQPVRSTIEFARCAHELLRILRCNRPHDGAQRSRHQHSLDQPTPNASTTQRVSGQTYESRSCRRTARSAQTASVTGIDEIHVTPQ